jgi:tRNA pseudouridine32 synthase/23S rRNA pseudouridine746 synthase
VIERKITIDTDNQPLIDALAGATNLSKQSLKSALDKGCVWLKTGKKN